MQVLMVLQIVAYYAKVKTHKQQQEHTGLHLAGNMDALGVGAVIQQIPMYQNLMLSSDATDHTTQSQCAENC